MKTVFLDTNVVIDLLDKREGFYPALMLQLPISSVNIL